MAIDLISKKRDGQAHSESEIRELVSAIVDGSMPDYQAAAWLMAVYLNGMDEAETNFLTLAMRDSGRRIDLSGVAGVKLDKHSSGGVGDKTTLVVIPLLASAGVPVLKMSGRGLGFSGGTIDKLESIPGFRTDLSVEEATGQVARIGAALIGQTTDLVPADKKLYALRDVTATIDSIPLISASIMSKKLAGGVDCVILDVKVGRGAFMKSLDRARELAIVMTRIGTNAGVKTVAALTNMQEPLGYSVGNAIEVREACDLLTGTGNTDTRFRELCLLLTAQGLVLGGKAANSSEALSIAEGLLEGGHGAAKLEEIIEAQGGDKTVVRNSQMLVTSGIVRRVRADSDGYLIGIDAEAVGRLCVSLGGGREMKEDTVDHSVGIMLHKKTGDSVKSGEVLADIYIRQESASSRSAESLKAAFDIGPEPAGTNPVIYELIGE